MAGKILNLEALSDPIADNSRNVSQEDFRILTERI